MRPSGLTVLRMSASGKRGGTSCPSSYARARGVAQRSRQPVSGWRPSARPGEDAGEEVVARVELDLDPGRFVTRPEGRQAWLRQGRRALEAQRDQEARPVARGRHDRIVEVKRGFDEGGLCIEQPANALYEPCRATAG